MKPVEYHGMTNTPEYYAWASLRDRCKNSNTVNYHRYGGRGIKVCDRWQNSFQAFYEDMGPRPSAEHSIDRKDNDGDYEPNNCRWATKEEQVYNRSTNIKILVPTTGELLTSKETSEKLGINQNTLYSRLNRGIDIEIPVEERNRIYTYNGRIYTMNKLASFATVDSGVIYWRIKNGWSVEDAVNLPLTETNKHNYRGLWLTTEEIAEMENIETYNLRHHLRKGTSIEEAVQFIKRNHQLVKDNNTGEIKSLNSDLYKRHGQVGTSLYTLWNNIRQWYNNPKSPDYRYYGGKGYKVSPRWLLSYQNFQTDVGERPSKEHILRPIQKEIRVKA